MGRGVGQVSETPPHVEFPRRVEPGFVFLDVRSDAGQIVRLTLARELSDLLVPGSDAEAHLRKVLPTPGHYLGVGDHRLLDRDVQLLVVLKRRIDQRDQVGVLEEVAPRNQTGITRIAQPVKGVGHGAVRRGGQSHGGLWNAGAAPGRHRDN